jgi:TRAP-type transport system small permease protein
MSGLRKANEFLLKVATWAVIAAMGVIALVIPYEVFGRYVLNRMPVWSGELAVFSLAWASMMGAAVGLRRGYQVGMLAVLEKLPPRAARMVQGVGYLFMLVFLTVMLYHGAAQALVNWRQISPGMEVRMFYPYLALPLGFGLMLSLTLEDLLRFLGAGAPQEAARC